MKTYLLILWFVAVLSSCSEVDTDPKSLVLDMPDLEALTTEEARFFMGRALFYDKSLSLNNTVSCASCHKQHLAFADDKQFSVGLENKLTARNSMPIQNLNDFSAGVFLDNVAINDTGFISRVSSTPLFWDGRESFLQDMVLQPVINHVEMGIRDLDELAAKLETKPEYQELTSKVYSENELTPEIIADALTAFVSQINSTNTKLDRYFIEEEELNSRELLGMELFIETYDCNSCHQVQFTNGYMFSGTFANIGLDREYTDEGLENITGEESDNGKFKIPSLRNVALTGPYMHDGRFETLEEVIDHYSKGLKNTEQLDIRLRNEDSTPLALDITDSERSAIISFLETLTDHDMISDQRFSNPFILQ